MENKTVKLTIEERNLISVFIWGEPGLCSASPSWDDIMQVVSKIAEYRLAYPKETSWVCDCKIVVYKWALVREILNFIKWYNDHGK